MLFMLRSAGYRKAILPMEFYLCGMWTYASDQIPTWTDSTLKHGLEPGQPRGMDSSLAIIHPGGMEEWEGPSAVGRCFLGYPSLHWSPVPCA